MKRFPQNGASPSLSERAKMSMHNLGLRVGLVGVELKQGVANALGGAWLAIPHPSSSLSLVLALILSLLAGWFGLATLDEVIVIELWLFGIGFWGAGVFLAVRIRTKEESFRTTLLYFIGVFSGSLFLFLLVDSVSSFENWLFGFSLFCAFLFFAIGFQPHDRSLLRAVLYYVGVLSGSLLLSLFVASFLPSWLSELGLWSTGLFLAVRKKNESAMRYFAGVLIGSLALSLMVVRIIEPIIHEPSIELDQLFPSGDPALSLFLLGFLHICLAEAIHRWKADSLFLKSVVLSIAGLLVAISLTMLTLLLWWILSLSLGKFWALLPATLLMVWLLRARTLSATWSAWRWAVGSALGLTLALVWLLFATMLEVSASQQMRAMFFDSSLAISNFELPWVIFSFGLPFLIICFATASAWRIIELALTKERKLAFASYALGWLVAIVSITLVWPGWGTMMVYDTDPGTATDLGKWQTQDLPSELWNASLNYVYTSSNGALWLATDKGVAFQAADGWQIYTSTATEGISLQSVNWIGEDRLGRLWLADSYRLFWMDEDGVLQSGPETIFRFAGGNRIQNVTFDANARPWVLISDRRLFSFDPGNRTWDDERKDLNLPFVRLTSFWINTNNFAWLGTTKGIYIGNWDGNRVSWLRLDESPRSVREIGKAADGTVWAETDSTIHWLVQGQWSKSSDANYEAFGGGYGWAIDPDGTISEFDLHQATWAKINNNIWYSLIPFLGLRFNISTSTVIDARTGDLWVTIADVLPVTNLALARVLVVLLLVTLVATPPALAWRHRQRLPDARLAEMRARLTANPETLYLHLRAISMADEDTRRVWLALAQSNPPEGAPTWHKAARGYIQLLKARENGLAAELSAFVQHAPTAEDHLSGAAEIWALYRWLNDALSTTDTRAIAQLTAPTKQLIDQVDTSYVVNGQAFHPVEPFIADWLSGSMLLVCQRTADYEAAATIESKLASLGVALGHLTPLEQPGAAPGFEFPEVKLSRLLVNRWRQIIRQEFDRVRGPAALRVTLASRNLPSETAVTLSIIVENIGHVTTEQIRVTLNQQGDYQFVGTPNDAPPVVTLGDLPAGGQRQADFPIHPLAQGNLRVLYSIDYTDSVRNERKHLEYPDVVHLLAEEANFRLIPNPYIAGTPVETKEMFFGRIGALAFAKQNLTGTQQHNVLVFYGQRRIGKTSILKQLPQVIDSAHYLFIFLDLQGYADVSTSAFLFDLADEIEFHLKQAGLTVPPLNETEFEQDASGAFNRFVRNLKPALDGKTLVLMLDEFETLERKVRSGKVSAEVYELLRHHMQHSAHLAFIFAGTERLFELSQDYWSVLFNIALFYEVGFLDEESATALVTEPIRGYLQVDEQAVKKIVTLTSGHAYFIQIICRHLVNRMNEVHRSTATVSDVDRVLQTTVESANAPISFLYQEQASPEEQRVLSALAEALESGTTAVGVPQIHQILTDSGFNISEEKLLNQLNHLVDRKILAQSYLRGHFFHFTVDLVRLWILRNKPLERLAKL